MLKEDGQVIELTVAITAATLVIQAERSALGSNAMRNGVLES